LLEKSSLFQQAERAILVGVGLKEQKDIPEALLQIEEERLTRKQA
jgi:hypothetical protein